MRRLTDGIILLKVLLSVALCAAVTGCTESSTIGRFRAMPVTNIILDSIGVVDEEPEQFVGAREPELKDLRVLEQEYVIQPGDVISITILDLFQSGAQWGDVKQVNETGRITIPEIGTIQVAGRTRPLCKDQIDFG